LRGARKISQIVDAAEDVAHPHGKSLSERGQAHLPRAAFKQGCAQTALHLLDLHGQGGLRDGANGGGVTEVALLGQGLEIAQLFEGESFHNLKLWQQSVFTT
jgi:hypothetical protein